MSNDTDDDETIREQLANANIGAGVTAWLSMLSLLPVFLLTPLLGVIPPSWKIYHKLTRWSAYQMQKAASADAVANVRRKNGKEDLLPAAYKEGAEDGHKRSGWAIIGLGDKRYDPGIHGGSTVRYGKADIIHVDEDETHQGSWEEAALDNAFQMERDRYLFREATANVTRVNVGAQQGGGDQPAVTDGGQATEQYRQRVTLDRPGVLEDTIIPVDSPEGYDGQVARLSQFRSVQTETGDQDTVRDAKNAGWLAAKMDENGPRELMKWVLILGCIGAMLLFDDELGAAIASFGGGGGAVDSATSGLGMVGGHMHLLAGSGVF